VKSKIITCWLFRYDEFVENNVVD